MIDIGTSMTSGRVTSRDGTPIGYLKTGRGPAVVIMHGSMESARSHTLLARALADDFTVYLPDRRGRGLSGPHRPDHSVRTEVEDLQAVLAESGAQLVFGVSAGGLVVLEAARTLPGIRMIAVYEPALAMDATQEHRLAGALRPRAGRRQAGRRDDHQHGRAAAGAAVLQDHAAPPAGITHREGHEERGLQGRPGRHHDAQAGARPFTTKACSSPRWPAPSTRSGRSPPTS